MRASLLLLVLSSTACSVVVNDFERCEVPPAPPEPLTQECSLADFQCVFGDCPTMFPGEEQEEQRAQCREQCLMNSQELRCAECAYAELVYCARRLCPPAAYERLYCCQAGECGETGFDECTACDVEATEFNLCALELIGEDEPCDQFAIFLGCFVFPEE